MDLELRHLRLVAALAEAGTQRAAARRLHLTQSALSQQLRLLEDRLGGPLFDRSGRRSRPTAAGLRLVDAARVLLPEADRAEAETRALAAGRAGPLRFATACYLSYGWLPALVRSYGEAWPAVGVRVVADVTDVAGGVRDGALDVGLVTVAGGDVLDGVETVPLFEDEVVAVVPSGHPWAALAEVPATAFAGEPLFAGTSALDPAKPFGRVLAEAGVAPGRVTAMPAESGAAVEMARGGLGVTVMAAWAARPETERGGVAAVPVGGRPTLGWAAAVRPGRRPPYVAAFVQALRDHHPAGGSI